MRRLRMLSVLLLAAACTADDSAPTSPASLQEPNPEIQDAAHNGGVAGFYFLPPLVEQPRTSGTFDATRSTVVYVCSLGGSLSSPPAAACTAPGVRTSDPVVDVNGQHYHSNWQIDRTTFPPGSYYRICVLDQSLAEWGHADVYLGGTGAEFKHIDRSEFVPLLDGRTLPIKYRIETGATPRAGSTACGSESVPL
ncbi:MAG TPA: hypothetical protein VNL96_07010 [Gemmatimonadaceae bacterium]|nr:hypothetical protein [Gemmatimonadaceae bacterium]